MENGNFIDQDLMLCLSRHGETPPNGDKVMQAFYLQLDSQIQAWHLISDSDKRKERFPFVEAVREASQIRLTTASPQQVSRLIFPSLVFEVWKELGYQDTSDHQRYFKPDFPDYLQRTNHYDWRDPLNDFFSHPKHRAGWMNSMLNRSISTTIERRYAGLKIVLNILYAGESVSVLDVGAGFNTGLRAVGLNRPDIGPFNEIKDYSEIGVTDLLNEPTRLDSHSLGIDLADFNDSDTRLWARACGHTPSEYTQLLEHLAFERDLKRAVNIDTEVGNFLDLKGVGPFKVAHMATLLHQLHSDRERKMFLDQAFDLVTEDGIVVISDFADGDPNNPDTGLNFNVRWEDKPDPTGRPYFGGYKTLVCYRPSEGDSYSPIPILAWSNGRCRDVTMGDAGDMFFCDF